MMIPLTMKNLIYVMKSLHFFFEILNNVVVFILCFHIKEREINSSTINFLLDETTSNQSRDSKNESGKSLPIIDYPKSNFFKFPPSFLLFILLYELRGRKTHFIIYLDFDEGGKEESGERLVKLRHNFSSSIVIVVFFFICLSLSVLKFERKKKVL